jgi:hypothetical protein
MRQWKSVTPSGSVTVINMNNFHWRMGLSVCPCLRFVVFIYFFYNRRVIFVFNIPSYFLPLKLTPTSLPAHLDVWLILIATSHTPKVKDKTRITCKFLWPLHFNWNGHTHTHTHTHSSNPPTSLRNPFLFLSIFRRYLWGNIERAILASPFFPPYWQFSWNAFDKLKHACSLSDFLLTFRTANTGHELYVRKF